MDSSAVSTTVAILLSILVGYASIVYFLSPKYDSREPPVISHFIPYVGHILGLIRYGQRYFQMIRYVNLFIIKGMLACGHSGKQTSCCGEKAMVLAREAGSLQLVLLSPQCISHGLYHLVKIWCSRQVGRI